MDELDAILDGGILDLPNIEDIADDVDGDALLRSLADTGAGAVEDTVQQQQQERAADELPILDVADVGTTLHLVANTLQQQQQQQQQQQPSNPGGDSGAKKRGGNDSGLSSGESRTPSPASKKIKQVRAVAGIAIFFNKSFVNC